MFHNSNYLLTHPSRRSLALANFSNLSKIHDEVVAKKVNEDVKTKAEIIQVSIM